MDRLAIDQPIDVRSAAAVAAEKPVIAHDSQIAGLRDRLVGRFGYVVGIGQSLLDALVDQSGKLVLRRATPARMYFFGHDAGGRQMGASGVDPNRRSCHTYGAGRTRRGSPPPEAC